MNKYITTFLTVCVIIGALFFGTKIFRNDYSARKIKVGFVYIGDTGTAYTNNFFRAQMELEDAMEKNVQTVAKFNITDDACEEALSDLISQGCTLIFTTSYGYEGTTKRIAEKNPSVQFCQATGENAHSEPFVPNYHNFMGNIFEGRYISGVVAGMKLLDLLEQNKISRDNAKIGYVAAFPYPEVISGYTAFFLGVRSVVSDTKMKVLYTNTWSNHIAEKKYTESLIDDGCVIISQHSDTTGPAIACEEASSKRGKTVFHVGYNQSMADVAPTTSLVSSRINWTPYVINATKAVLEGKKIEKALRSTLPGNDTGGGIGAGWVEIIGLNHLIAAKGTELEIERISRQLKTGDLEVFRGNYIGINPFDESDVWDLRRPFAENATQSAPRFHYVLKDVIFAE